MSILAAALAPSPGSAQLPVYVAPTPLELVAPTVRAYAAPEADQGVAVEKRSFYAIDNTVIAQYDRETGAPMTRWQGPKNGLVRHINSCFANRGALFCANSNYSLTPMASSVEVFSTSPLAHHASHSLGLMDEGSLTWFDRLGRGWIAGFAHYDGNGGHPFKSSAFTGVVTFDRSWRRTGGWAFPASVLERMAPHSASGGALGPDRLLYVLGHDRQELYVLAKPVMGPTLLHVATIAVEAEGQAFSWDRSGKARRIFAIDRRKGRVIELDVPTVDLKSFPDARRF